MIGKLYGVVIDCPDPTELSEFYRVLFDFQVVYENDKWVVLGGASESPKIGFQKADVYTSPTWPDPAVPQQMHLEIQVDDLDESERRVLELGARRLDGGSDTSRVFADPVGHPFCLTKM